MNQKLRKIKNILQSEKYFLIGTIIIAITWIVQNFYLNIYNEKVDQHDLNLSRFENYLIHLKIDGDNYRYIQLTKDPLTLSDSLEATRRYFNSILNCLYSLSHLPADSIDEDQVHIAYNSLFQQSDNFNKSRNIKPYMNFVNSLNGELNKLQRDYQIRGEIYRKKITQSQQNSQYVYILLFIVGSVFITYHRGSIYIKKNI